jgi:hypothetical protein
MLGRASWTSWRGLLACDCTVVLVVGEASLMLPQAACTFPSTRSRVDQSQNSILKIQVICLRRMSARLKRLCRSAPPAFKVSFGGEADIAWTRRKRTCPPRMGDSGSGQLETNKHFEARRGRCAADETVNGRVALTINPLQLPLRDLDGALGVLAAGAIAREHVDQHEIRNRACCLLSDRAQPAGCK